jgi:hypothetical protein
MMKSSCSGPKSNSIRKPKSPETSRLPHASSCLLYHLTYSGHWPRIEKSVNVILVEQDRFQSPAQCCLYVPDSIPCILHWNMILHFPCEENRALSSRWLLEHALLHSTTLDVDPELTKSFQDPVCVSSQYFLMSDVFFYMARVQFTTQCKILLPAASLCHIRRQRQRCRYFYSALGSMMLRIMQLCNH